LGVISLAPLGVVKKFFTFAKARKEEKRGEVCRYF